MPRHKKPAKDPNEIAHHLVELSTGRDNVALPTKAQISALMAELGRKGGKKGGKRRLETMTAKERSAFARKAAHARWSTG
jgi:hypothetical protein